MICQTSFSAVMSLHDRFDDSLRILVGRKILRGCRKIRFQDSLGFGVRVRVRIPAFSSVKFEGFGPVHYAASTLTHLACIPYPALFSPGLVSYSCAFRVMVLLAMQQVNSLADLSSSESRAADSWC